MMATRFRNENRDQVLPSKYIFKVFDRVWMDVVSYKPDSNQDRHRPVVDNSENLNARSMAIIEMDGFMTYQGFADDFGPLSLASTFQFCSALEDHFKEDADRLYGLQCGLEPRTITNAVFLIGAYLIMRRDCSIDDVMAICEPVKDMVVPFRDVSRGPQNFDLRVQDCWGGLVRAKRLGWVDFSPDGNGFDLEEYLNYDSPLNADMHVVVPDKLIAMRGPVDVKGGGLWRDVVGLDGTFRCRNFSPHHTAETLQQFDVRLVVRLNDPAYDTRPLHEAGIATVDLPFEDCTVPPVEVVAKFLAVVEGLPGAVAVHCKAGLGRTGTLIGLYMMKHHGFTAREAMVRPGSVIGPQQQFLCEREGLMRRSLALPRPAGVSSPPCGIEETQRYADAVVRFIGERFDNVRGISRARSDSGPGSVAEGEGFERSESLAAEVGSAVDQRNGRRVRKA
jgi:cell division cycle 14